MQPVDKFSKIISNTSSTPFNGVKASNQIEELEETNSEELRETNLDSELTPFELGVQIILCNTKIAKIIALLSIPQDKETIRYLDSQIKLIDIEQKILQDALDDLKN